MERLRYKKIRYVEELNYFNAIACLLVIMIHVLSIAVSHPDEIPNHILAVYLPWRLAQFVVPAFLFSGAVKMALAFEVEDAGNGRMKNGYADYIAERCRSILLPYAVYVTVYYAVFVKMEYIEPSWKTLLTGIVTGNMSGHFYYVVLIVQFYILKPLWKKMIRHCNWLIIVLSAFAVSAVMAQSGRIFRFFNIEFYYMDRLFPTYILFWASGLYVGKYYDRVKDIIPRRKALAVISGVIIVCNAVVMYIGYINKYQSSVMGYIKLLIDCLSIFVLLSVCIYIQSRADLLTEAGRHVLQGRLAQALRQLFSKIHKASYHVYLSHSLFILVVTTLLQQAGIYDMGTLLLVRTIVGYTAPFLLYFICMKIKYMFLHIIKKI